MSKQRNDYYCKGCGTEISIFGLMGKDTSVFCKICQTPMYEVIIAKKTSHNRLKWELMLFGRRYDDKMPRM